MALPPSQNFWMWTMITMMMIAVGLQGALQKCVFDEVQARVRVVTAAPVQQKRPHTEARVGSHSGQGASPQRAIFVMKRSEQALSYVSPRMPIRIRLWVPRESRVLWEAEQARLKPAVEEAVGVVSSLLAVNRVDGPLLLSRDIDKYCKFLWKNSSAINYNRCGRAKDNYRAETCLDVTIPDDHLAGIHVYPGANSPHRLVLRHDGVGVSDADFLLYLHVWSTDKCRAEPSVLAYAVHCQTDAHGRPLAGVVVICRERLRGSSHSHQATVQTVIHELIHALGFSKDLFSSWTDCSSSAPPQSTHCPPGGMVTHTDGTGQMRIYTPSVVLALQRHLASSDPTLGAPLENWGVSPGKASSHWEARVLQGSIMGAALGDPTTVRMDQVTLAALQDTGWYSVNLSRAQNLVWGRGEGATFGSASRCHDNSSSFFCSGSGLGCHHLHVHKGECQTDQFLDGCRLYKALENGSECWRETHRRSPEAEDSGEIFGPGSRCFFSNLTRKNQNQNRSVGGCCYRHRCTGVNQYQIQVSGSGWTECPAGGAIRVSGYQGLVFCPHMRLCVYSDVAPPSPAASAGLCLALGVVAGVCAVAAAVLACVWYRSGRDSRVHDDPEAPTQL